MDLVQPCEIIELPVCNFYEFQNENLTNKAIESIKNNQLESVGKDFNSILNIVKFKNNLELELKSWMQTCLDQVATDELGEDLVIINSTKLQKFLLNNSNSPVLMSKSVYSGILFLENKGNYIKFETETVVDQGWPHLIKEDKKPCTIYDYEADQGSLIIFPSSVKFYLKFNSSDSIKWQYWFSSFWKDVQN